MNSDKTKTVYEERSTIETFVKELLGAYGFSKEDIESMLFSTEIESASKEQQDRCYKLSDELESKLLRAIKEQGTGKLKGLLRQKINTFTSHAGKDYNYDKVKDIWKSWGQSGAKAGGAASHAFSHQHAA